MVKAFLSHSSQDKSFVQPVVAELNAANVHYDVRTFQEGTPSEQAILEALSDTNLFVLFASGSSLSSSWVRHEIDLAQHLVASGQINKVVAFIIDETDPDLLPLWLRRYVYRRERNPKLVANILRSHLIEIDVQNRSDSDIFLGRDEELQNLKSAISRPSSRTPSVIYISGWEGIGRRTLVRRAIRDTLPWMGRVHPEITLLDFEGVLECYRRILDYTEARTPADWRSLVTQFAALDEDEQAKRIAIEIHQLAERKQVAFIRDRGALLRETGVLQTWLEKVISNLAVGNTPKAVIISRRAVSFGRRRDYPRVHFMTLKSLPLDTTGDILNLWLKQHGLVVSQSFLDSLAPFLGGNPRNIEIAAEFAREFGVARLDQDKVQFREVIRERSTELLRMIELTDLQKKIISLLGDYQYMDLEDMFIALGDEQDNQDVEVAMRHLEDHGVIEWETKYFRLAPYLTDVISRFAWGATLRQFRTGAASRLIERFSEFETTDLVTVSAIDAAVLSAVRGGKIDDVRWIGHFLLPSHLLRIAREEYDSRRHRAALRLCQQALDGSYALTPDAQIEAWRLAAMSAARLGDEVAFGRAVGALGGFRTSVADRNRCFVHGFRERLSGQVDRAEEWYRKALAIDPGNFHVLRELAQVLCAQERFDEAEIYARDAYGRAPTNPFVIDNLLDVIIGKSSIGDLEGNREIEDLLDELRDQETRTETHLFEQRLAKYYSKVGLRDKALEWADKAVRAMPKLFNVYVTRARIKLELGRVSEVNQDIEELQRIATDAATGEGKSNRFLLTDIRVRYHLARGEPEVARSVLTRFGGTMPRHVREKLSKEVSTARQITNLHNR